MNSLPDIIKLISKEKIEELVDKFFEKGNKGKIVKIENFNKEVDKEKLLGIFGLMCILLAFSNEIFSWTEKTILLVLKSKNINVETQNKIKEFCSKFWKNKSINWNLDGEFILSETLIEKIREIANPYNYYS